MRAGIQVLHALAATQIHVLQPCWQDLRATLRSPTKTLGLAAAMLAITAYLGEKFFPEKSRFEKILEWICKLFA